MNETLKSIAATPAAGWAVPTCQRSLTELRAALKVEAKAAAERTQVAFAESVAIEAIRAYWSCLTTELPLQEPPERRSGLPEPLIDAARRLGEAVAPLSVSDAAYHLGLLYTGLLRPEWRAKRGVYYTPPALANRLLDQAEVAGLDWADAHVLDPAAGAAAFLVPAAERMLATLGNCTPAFAIRILSTRLRGCEIDPFAAWMGEVFLEAVALPVLVRASHRLSNVITVCDSLKLEPPATGFDLVIGNPPFGKVSLPSRQRTKFARSLYGHANLYGLFMDLSVTFSRPGGLISFLTPSSFLAGEYFKNLRSVLWSEAPPVSLDFVTSRKGVFEDVLQETLLATYKRGGGRSCSAVSFIHPQPHQPAVAKPAGCFTLPEDSKSPWILPRHDDEEKLARTLRSMPCRLADWGYKVSTGPLVWNRHKSQLRDTKGKSTIPLVWAESITSDGRFVFRSERKNHKPYLKLRSKEDDWLIVKNPCVLLQRTTAKEQARRLIATEMPAAFIEEHGGVTVENHINMLVPTTARPAISAGLLAAFLNSTAADRAFRCLSGSVAVSAYELENLPLPAPDQLKQLVGRKTDRAAIEKACLNLYGEDGAA